MSWQCFLYSQGVALHYHEPSRFVHIWDQSLSMSAINIAASSVIIPYLRKLDCLFSNLFRLTAKDIKLSITCPCCGGIHWWSIYFPHSTGDRWLPLTEGPVIWKRFPCQDPSCAVQHVPCIVCRRIKALFVTPCVECCPRVTGDNTDNRRYLSLPKDNLAAILQTTFQNSFSRENVCLCFTEICSQGSN